MKLDRSKYDQHDEEHQNGKLGEHQDSSWNRVGDYWRDMMSEAEFAAEERDSNELTARLAR